MPVQGGKSEVPDADSRGTTTIAGLRPEPDIITPPARPMRRGGV